MRVTQTGFCCKMIPNSRSFCIISSCVATSWSCVCQSGLRARSTIAIFCWELLIPHFYMSTLVNYHSLHHPCEIIFHCAVETHPDVWSSRCKTLQPCLQTMGKQGRAEIQLLMIYVSHSVAVWRHFCCGLIPDDFVQLFWKGHIAV